MQQDFEQTVGIPLMIKDRLRNTISEQLTRQNVANGLSQLKRANTNAFQGADSRQMASSSYLRMGTTKQSKVARKKRKAESFGNEKMYAQLTNHVRRESFVKLENKDLAGYYVL